jgi:hypothetical protein
VSYRMTLLLCSHFLTLYPRKDIVKIIEKKTIMLLKISYKAVRSLKNISSELQ